MDMSNNRNKSESEFNGIKPKAHNEIGNRELKERIANAAVSMLLKPDEDYNELAGLTLQFGYLFVLEGHGVEALFKITTDKTTVYCAAQVDKLLRLNFNEALFEDTTRTFLEMHEGSAT